MHPEWKLNGRLGTCTSKLAKFKASKVGWGPGLSVLLCSDCLPFWLDYARIADDQDPYVVVSLGFSSNDGRCQCTNMDGDSFYCCSGSHPLEEALLPQDYDFTESLKAAGYDQLLEDPTPGSQPTTATTATTPTKDSTS